MALNRVAICLAAASIVECLMLEDHPVVQNLVNEGESSEANPCTDPDFPFAALVGNYTWCYTNHGSAAVKAKKCTLWCTLDAASGDACEGCCGDISSKVCKQQAATPAPTPDVFPFSFVRSHVAENNLGDMGPAFDPWGIPASASYIRFKHVDARSGMVDLVVSNLSKYEPDDSSMNGLTHKSPWAKVNLKCGTSTTLRFAFEQSDSGIPMIMGNFIFTVGDLDQGTHGHCRESVEVDGYADYWTSDFTELTVSQTMGATVFRSNIHGDHKDNPRTTELTEQQANRAVSFRFQRAQSFTVTITTSEGAPGMRGRNFMFAGATSLSPRR